MRPHMRVGDLVCQRGAPDKMGIITKVVSRIDAYREFGTEPPSRLTGEDLLNCIAADVLIDSRIQRIPFMLLRPVGKRSSE